MVRLREAGWTERPLRWRPAGDSNAGDQPEGPDEAPRRPKRIAPVALPTLHRLAALDGLRGVAIAAVFAYHLGFFPGGFLGVDLFFVLSGFLVTRLLVTEQRLLDHIEMKEFWRRRVRRLFPALVAMLAGVALLSRFGPESLAAPAELPRQAASSVVSMANWLGIATRNDYFTDAASSPLAHVWSLSIEEQFYLAFPFLVGAVIRRSHGDLRPLTALLAGTTAVSWLWGIALLLDGNGISRTYLDSGARIGTMTVGAIAALLITTDAYDEQGGDRRIAAVRAFCDHAAPGALAAMLAIALTAPRVPTEWSALRWVPMQLFAVATAIVLVAATHTPTPRSMRFSLTPAAQKLGLVSYGLYLWHVPVIWVGDRIGASWPRPVVMAAEVVVSIGIAYLSHYYIELPVRGGALRRTDVRLVAAATLLLVAGSLTSMWWTSEPARAAKQSRVTDVPDIPVAVLGANEERPEIAKTAATAAVDDVDDPGAPLFPLDRPAGRPPRILVVGDSVAQSLGRGLALDSNELAIRVDNVGTPQCGVGFFTGQVQLASGQIVDGDDERCRTWHSTFTAYVAGSRPDLVIYNFGGTQRGALEIDGRWEAPCTPAHDRWYEEAVRSDIETLRSTGAPVAIATMAYNRFGVPPRDTTSEDRAVDCFNRRLAAIAADTSGVDLLPVGEWICPTRECIEKVDGVTLRQDGLHYDDGGGSVAARWVIDETYGV